ncbi:hypothetical protein ACFORL_00665 [Legionella dresdenensis]|uniref:Flagellar protein FlaG n=1 Tax=Legionella dresdenensis TaxID=450200 RepID=A0ABV8CBN5_9GAMM
MNIDPANIVNPQLASTASNTAKVDTTANLPSKDIVVQLSTDQKQKVEEEQQPPHIAVNQLSFELNKDTGVLQTVVTESIDNSEVVRKMPTDEYLKLLSLLDDIIDNTIDKQV